MGLDGPLPRYQQPDEVVNGLGTNIGGDMCTCPLDGTVARRVGTRRFSYRCQHGHQFDLSPSTGLVFSTAVAPGVLPVRDERK